MMGWWMVALLGCPAPTPPLPSETDLPVDTDPPVDTDLPVDTDVPIPPPPVPTEVVLSACVPALSLEPLELVTEAGTVVQLIGEGGMGSYRFEVMSGDALVDPRSGVVAFGEATGQVEIRLSDDGCLGTGSLDIEVVAPMEVAPAYAMVPFGVVFDFEVQGGSGDVSCSSSTATLTGCTLDAGATAGSHIITIEDTRTGAIQTARIDVVEGAAISVLGAEQIHIPMGASWVPEVTGGSGLLDLSITGPFSVSGQGFEATGPGEGLATITDRITHQVLTVPVRTIVPLVPVVDFFGVRSLTGTVVSLPDVTGDGLPDAAIGTREISLGAHLGGGVEIYASTPTGLASSPVWTASGDDPGDQLGESILVHDMNNDGLPDLLVGGLGVDHFNGSSGVVQVYHGLPGGLFETSPGFVFTVAAGDLFGVDLAICDFDGDGFDDLAVGAYGAEDRGAAVVATNQGGVAIYRGSNTGFGSFPDLWIYGTVPDGAGGWEGSRNLNMGYRIAAGDMNGDGLCDLVAGNYFSSWTGDLTDYGFLSVYAGTDANGLVVERTPSMVFVNDVDTNGQFGRSLAMGDVDGDGKQDLVVGQINADWGGTNGGAVHLFFGGDFPSDPFTPITAEEADWSRQASSGDVMGADVKLRDNDGDGLADLWIGAPADEIPDSTPNRGTIERWDATTILASPPNHVAITELPDAIWEGPLDAGFFGQAFEPFADLDGDGNLDLLVLSGREEQRGVDVAEGWYVGQSGPTAVDLLNLPSGQAFGTGLAVADVTGDGVEDLVVGGPDDGSINQNYAFSAGTVTAFRGLATGISTSPLPLERSHVQRGAGDRWGYGFSSVDFDGDGDEELSVLARTDSRPANYSNAAWANPAGCSAYSAGATGAVWVYDTDGGLAEQPSFAWFPPDPSDTVRSVTSGDFDGDGKGDLGIASRGWGGGGGFAILHGRTGTPDKVQLICDAARWTTEEVGAGMDVVVAVPDVDGDGCDELAVGAETMEAGGLPTRGVVWLLWGYGAACNSPDPEVSVFAPSLRNQYAGSSLAAGDVDGDGGADLVVGSYNRFRAGAGQGAFWVLPTAWLQAAPRIPLTGELLPAQPSVSPMSPPTGVHMVPGPIPGGRFGGAVALVPDLAHAGRMQVAVGVERGAVGGTYRAGGVHFYRWEEGVGIAQIPHALVVGESNLPEGELGATLVSGQIEGRPVLAVGAPLSDRDGRDVGAAYVVEVGP